MICIAPELFISISAFPCFALNPSLLMQTFVKLTRALLRQERTMNLLCHQREGGRNGGRGGMTVIHILMAPQYLNNNHVTYYVIT